MTNLLKRLKQSYNSSGNILPKQEGRNERKP